MKIRAFMSAFLMLVGVMFTVTSPYPVIPHKLEINFGGVFYDVTDKVHAQTLEITYGALDEMGEAQAAELRFELDNPDGDFTPERVESPYWPYVQPGTEIKYSIFWDGVWFVRAWLEASEWLPTWPYGDLSVDDDEDGGSLVGEARVTVVASGVLRRLGQGEPPSLSAHHRAIAFNEPVGHWPLSDGVEAIANLPAVGTTPMIFGAFRAFGGGFPAPDADPLFGQAQMAPWLEPGLLLQPSVASYMGAEIVGSSGGEFAVDYVTSGVGGNFAAYTVDNGVGITGDLIVAWYWEADDATGMINLFYFTVLAGIPTSTLIGSFAAPTLFNGTTPHHVRLHVIANGAGADYALRVDGTAIASGNVATLAVDPLTFAGFTWTNIANESTGISHIVVWDNPPAAGQMTSSMLGYPDEMAGDRIERACLHQGEAVTIIGSESELCGPQQVDTFLGVCSAAAAVDAGIFGETHDVLGLLYRCGATLLNPDPDMFLDAAANELSNPFAPTLDDQAVTNDLTVTRIDGSSYRAVKTVGPKSVQPAPDGVGPYRKSLSLNLATDIQAAYAAEWAVWLATFPGMRYPSVSPALDIVADLFDEWLPMGIGDVAQVFNLPPQHPSGEVGLQVRGWVERHTPGQITLRLNATPSAPYEVGVSGDDGAPAGAWSQTGPLTRLSAALNSGVGTATVTIDGGLFNISDPVLAASPMSIVIGPVGYLGEICPVTDISGGASPQTFTITRTVAKTWPINTPVQVHRPLVAVL